MSSFDYLPYNPNDSSSIRDYAQRMIDSSFREIIRSADGNFFLKDGTPEYSVNNKGIYGLIAESYFHIYQNNISKPDFIDTGIELKSSPLKKLNNGKIVSKERLVLSIINYNDLVNEQWDNCSFLRKNSHLLLIFYLWKKDISPLDYRIKLVDLWRFPPGDLKIIKDDWVKIQKKIKDGKAHEISDGDTLFLGACTKGGRSSGLRVQPNSLIGAPQRAFNIKQKYLNFIIHALAERWYGPEIADKWGYKAERIVKEIEEYQEGETFDELVIRRFKKFYGKSIAEIKSDYGLTFPDTSKHRAYLISKAILGIKQENSIEEFEKAEIEIKTVTIEKNGRLKESMSFPAIKYKQIINQDFEDSDIYDILRRRFFFVIFQKDENKNLRLKRVMFWNMGADDLQKYREIYEDTRLKIRKGIYDDFIKISSGDIGHVRPHGANSRDLMETPQGTFEIKRSFWLNSNYIRLQIMDD
jgi:DNA mismatch repair protein MutH